MKPINLKNLIKTSKELDYCTKALRYAESMADRWPHDVHKAEEKLEEAKAEHAKAVAPVMDALDAVQKRAKCRTMDAWSIVQAIEEIEDRLDMISAKKDAVGTIAHVDYNAQHFPNAYKYTPESTQITIVLKSSGWTLTHIVRDACKAPANKITLELTDATKAHMAERVSRISA